MKVWKNSQQLAIAQQHNLAWHQIHKIQDGKFPSKRTAGFKNKQFYSGEERHSDGIKVCARTHYAPALE